MTIEDIKERVLAEALARPHISVALLDTLMGAPRAEIAGAVQMLVASGELVEVRGQPGTFKLRNAEPDRKLLLTLLSWRPRTRLDLKHAVAYAPELVDQAVDELIGAGQVLLGAKGVLRCTEAGLVKCGAHPQPPAPARHPYPVPLSAERDKLAAKFMPAVITWALYQDRPVSAEYCAERAYAYADALLGWSGRP